MDRLFRIPRTFRIAIILFSLFLLWGCTDTMGKASNSDVAGRADDYMDTDEEATMDAAEQEIGQIGGSHRIGGFDPQPEPDPKWFTVRAELVEDILSISNEEGQRDSKTEVHCVEHR